MQKLFIPEDIFIFGGPSNVHCLPSTRQQFSSYWQRINPSYIFSHVDLWELVHEDKCKPRKGLKQFGFY